MFGLLSRPRNRVARSSAAAAVAVSPTLTAVLFAALLGLVTACGSSPVGGRGASAAAASSGLSITDAYVKAVPKDGAMAMSAIFGVVSNSTDKDITLVKGASDVASSVELHEMVMDGGGMKMQPKKGGFVVPAGGSLTLEPGGLHVMLIGLTRDIKAGDAVQATVSTADGKELAIDAVGRDLPNANESYAPEESPGSMESMGSGG